jgi:excisionase family DNA binding protein
MKLTLEQAATRLGKSKRQVLYLIRNGGLPAEKMAGRWFIESDDLPLNPAQRHHMERKQRQLRAAVEEALIIEPEEEPAKRYSVQDLKAFQIALPLYRKACQVLSEEHPASRALKRVLELLSQGCHRFDRQEKADAYGAARDQASLAVCELVLTESEPADQLRHILEQDLMAALAGLMRRVDGRRRLSR